MQKAERVVDSQLSRASTGQLQQATGLGRDWCRQRTWTSNEQKSLHQGVGATICKRHISDTFPTQLPNPEGHGGGRDEYLPLTLTSGIQLRWKRKKAFFKADKNLIEFVYQETEFWKKKTWGWREDRGVGLGKKISSTEHILGVTKGDRGPPPHSKPNLTAIEEAASQQIHLTHSHQIIII